MTKSLRDKLKKLFFPENVPAYKIKLLAGLFSVALLHTIGSGIYPGLKENKNTEDKKNKYILWQDELNKLEKEKIFAESYVKKIILEIAIIPKESRPSHLLYKFKRALDNRDSLKDKLIFMHNLSDTLKNKNLSYQEAAQRYENYKSPNEK